MKRIRKYIIFIFIFVFAIILFVPININLNKTIPSIELSLNDPTFCKTVNVQISGVYTWRLIGNDSFKGNISFDTYKLTTEFPLIYFFDDTPSLIIKYDDDGFPLEYGSWNSNSLFGYMICSPLFSKFVVKVFEPAKNSGYYWNDTDGHIIVGPSTNVEEANKLYRIDKGTVLLS